MVCLHPYNRTDLKRKRIVFMHMHEKLDERGLAIISKDKTLHAGELQIRLLNKTLKLMLGANIEDLQIGKTFSAGLDETLTIHR